MARGRVRQQPGLKKPHAQRDEEAKSVAQPIAKSGARI